MDPLLMDPLLVPVQLDAFVLNPEVCGKEGDLGARIIPITQPNYTFLRLDDFVIQSDVQNHADVHAAVPADVNPRMTDLGTKEPLRNRHGVYLHWRLPRVYRSGTSLQDSPSNTTPEYTQPPTRWLVVRRVKLETIIPKEAKSVYKEYEAWVIDSDYRWKLDDVPESIDLQVELSPFVVGGSGKDVNIDAQAEVFIGRKTRLADWNEVSRDEGLRRPNINLLQSSNQLFADFQLHNGNVFSMLDNFSYQDGNSEKQYLDYAEADYYVIGWSFDIADDPLWVATHNKGLSRSAALPKIFMDLINPDAKSAGDWLKAKDQTCLLCHGAMYNVKWDHENKPLHVPADDFAKQLHDPKAAAVSIGTTPMDALITYISSKRQKMSAPTPNTPETPDSSHLKELDLIEKLEEDILAIDSLLHARDDGVEGQREAKETVYNWNYSRFQGGTRYYLTGDEDSGKPTDPDEQTKHALRMLNQLQLQYDACSRASDQYRWDMFSRWWTYVSDGSNKVDNPNDPHDRQFLEDTNKLAALIKAIDGFMKQVAEKIKSLKEPQVGHLPVLPNIKNGTLPFYYSGGDPTVLVAGIDSGWGDFLDPATVRTSGQTVSIPLSVDDEQNLLKLQELVKSKIRPGEIDIAIDALLAEFYSLAPATAPEKPPAEKSFPQFHDRKGPHERWRDQWGDTQPWFPLFVEWEAEYIEIPMKYWVLDQQTARLSDAPLVRYAIRVESGAPLYDELRKVNPEDPVVPTDPTKQKPLDIRRVSGRVLILPQPTFSLRAKVNQLFSDTPADILEPYLPAAQRAELLEGIHQLPYLSAPLSGLCDHLLTLAQGTHIKPENKTLGPEGEKITVIKKAQYDRAGLSEDNIKLIQSHSGLTPYAAMVDFPNHDICPFKPVTHGQLRFRKFNIIDKFGQALVAIDQKPRVDGPPPMFPAISDWFEPQLVGNDKSKANTVIKNDDYQCEFVQLPPQINQKARLNAHFLKSTAEDTWVDKTIKTKSPWRPATEWEQPVFGWIVVNYADYGIQFFLQDGTFYREVRVGGPSGALVSPKWMPFAPDTSEEEEDGSFSIQHTKLENESKKGKIKTQLDLLIEEMVRDSDYLRAFWSMITSALKALPPAPSTYAQFLNSIVGKPLALVNMGWSLELDGPPLRNQSKLVPKSPYPPLIRPDGADPDTEVYQFSIKLGDKEREYDGLVGYFDMSDDKQTLNLGNIKTYWPDAKYKNVLTPISTKNYPTFEAYWIAPFPEKENEVPWSSEAYDNQRNLKLHSFGAIVDPFTPVHAWSSILPATELKLPSWTWQEAMNKMTAFFHVGPLNIIDDVKDLDRGRILTTKNMTAKPPFNVALPALGAADWNWLQPYVDEKKGLDDPPLFNSYGIEAKGNLLQPGFQKGPYTAIEGFLQLRNPIMKDKA